MLRIAFAQVRAGIDRGQSHFLHVLLDGIAMDLHFLSIQNRRNPPGAQKRMLRVDFINPVLDANFLWGGRDRLVVQMGTIEAENVRLNGDRELCALPIQHGQALFTCLIRSQIFLIHAS